VPDERVTLREAAIRLRVSEGAIRKRVARGTIRSEMGDDGLRYVWVDGGPDVGTDASYTNGSQLVDELRDRVRHLEGQLDIRAEELREHRRIIAALTSRIPEIEPPREQTASQEPPGGPESVFEEPERAGRSAAGGAEEGAEQPRRRSWWREFFGFGE
jgi:hypothetical protein